MNEMRIMCNPKTDRISYLLKNEKGKWIPLSKASPLSQRFTVKKQMLNKTDEVVDILNNVYNKNNRGLEISFVGNRESFDLLQRALYKKYPESSIKWTFFQTKVALLGTIGSGKSTLIEAIKEDGIDLQTGVMEKGYISFKDPHNSSVLYEVNGIGREEGNIQKVEETIKMLVEQGLSKILYCVASEKGRIEDEEIKLIKKMQEEYSLTVAIVLTNCMKDKETIDELYKDINKALDHIKIIRTLAKAYKDRNNYVIPPFGIKDVVNYIYEE